METPDRARDLLLEKLTNDRRAAAKAPARAS